MQQLLNPGADTPVYFVGECSYLVNISDLIHNKINKETIRNHQGEVQDAEKAELAVTIAKDGLRNPILVYENSMTIVGGHNRHNSLTELRCDYAPVTEIPRSAKIKELFGDDGEIDPSNYYVLHGLSVDNQTVSQSSFAKYETVKSFIAAFERDMGREQTGSELRSDVKTCGMSINTFKMMYQLEYGYEHRTLGFVNPRLDLLKELQEQKEAKTVEGQYKAFMSDHALLYDPKKKFYSRDEYLEQVLSAFDWRVLTRTVSQELSYMRKRPWFASVPDRNFKSAASHHMIVHSFVEQFCSITSPFTATAVENGGRYDVHFYADGELVNTLEVKTTLNTGWTTANEKYGYVILFKFSDEMDRCFLMNTYLDRNWDNSRGTGRIWQQSGKGNAQLTLPDLHDYITTNDTFINVPFGELYQENKIVRVSTEPMVSSYEYF
tara:strand:+ start:1159 stop:2466 length:1308 start_codon:yes stop_codon:yes gene_type:complete